MGLIFGLGILAFPAGFLLADADMVEVDLILVDAATRNKMSMSPTGNMQAERNLTTHGNLNERVYNICLHHKPERRFDCQFSAQTR